MRWSRAWCSAGALVAGSSYVIGFIVLSGGPALACDCTDAHAIWWQEQHHSGGFIGALSRGLGGSSTAGLLLAGAVAAAAIGWTVRARRNRKLLVNGSDHARRTYPAADRGVTLSRRDADNRPDASAAVPAPGMRAP